MKIQDEKTTIESFDNIELNINVRGYTVEDGTVYVNLSDVCIGLGFTYISNKVSATSGGKSYELIRWNRVFKYLNSFDYIYDPIEIKKEDAYIPECIFYGLAMKAKNETAKTFQKWIATEVIPSIRKTGIFASKKYDPIRAMSVFARKLEASSINKLVMYSKAMSYPVKKGRLYTELSTMVNSLAKVPNGERDNAEIHQLAIIMFAELNIRDIVERGIGMKMDPGEVKSCIWEWLLQFSDSINKVDTPEEIIHKAKLSKFKVVK